jgi:hypothetical protein
VLAPQKASPAAFITVILKENNAKTWLKKLKNMSRPRAKKIKLLDRKVIPALPSIIIGWLVVGWPVSQ